MKDSKWWLGKKRKTENIDQSTTYVTVAACQLETAQFTATSDISVRDLWLIPGIAICT